MYRPAPKQFITRLREPTDEELYPHANIPMLTQRVYEQKTTRMRTKED